MTLYPVWPVKGVTLKVGDEFIVSAPFHSNVRLVLLRPAHVDSPGAIPMRRVINQAGMIYDAYVEGDAAYDLKRLGVERLQIVEVSEVSGVGQAKATGGST